MADALQDSSAPIPVSDSNDEIKELRSDLARLRAEVAAMREAVVQEAIGRIRLQGGGSTQVSGANGNFTITTAVPTGGSVSGEFDCTVDPPAFKGIVTLS